MPFAPQSWTVLQAIQSRIQQEVLVGGVSPFSLFNTAPNASNPTGESDAVRYGTNPNGNCANAIFIGVPKDWPSPKLYPKMCHIIPPYHRMSSRHAFGGKTWDWSHIYIRFVFDRTLDWYQAQQDILAAADAAYTVFATHAEMPNASGVQASILDAPGQIPAYHHDEAIGAAYECWGFVWRLKQEWTVSGGVQP